MATTEEVQNHLQYVLGVDKQHIRTADDTALALATVSDCARNIMQLVSILNHAALFIWLLLTVYGKSPVRRW